MGAAIRARWGERADANARDAAGSTPLLEATSRETIATLLREGADGSMRRGDGSNALHLACDRADGWAVEALLGCGVDCDARDGSRADGAAPSEGRAIRRRAVRVGRGRRVRGRAGTHAAARGGDRG